MKIYIDMDVNDVQNVVVLKTQLRMSQPLHQQLQQLVGVGQTGLQLGNCKRKLKTVGREIMFPNRIYISNICAD
ncbi:uncharacterized protein LOC115562331 isoform X2 [Drosophila navojoa]|uniref:uncharacterized protein LOC115562331 isoform X2 n=1 Tax=Drosophila navojoa TaxID=7232 RepID=UPI0011BFAAEC|nr:uncharacterized protein LOC115562331 isoform X2 [Drosophila navojoa]